MEQPICAIAGRCFLVHGFRQDLETTCVAVPGRHKIKNGDGSEVGRTIVFRSRSTAHQHLWTTRRRTQRSSSHVPWPCWETPTFVQVEAASSREGLGDPNPCPLGTRGGFGGQEWGRLSENGV